MQPYDYMIMFMADNLYLISKGESKITYASLDGAKMEASHSMEDCR